MIINELQIRSFGGLRDVTIHPTAGVNLMEGANESGKSAAAMFIKFMFYGLSQKNISDGVTERRRYINWDTGTAAGTLTFTADDGKSYRVERSLTETTAGDKIGWRESIKVVDTETNTALKSGKGTVPGEIFFGVPEEIFVNTVFVRQGAGTAVDGAASAETIENLLFSASENTNVKKAIDKLDAARRALLYKNKNGGEIYDLMQRKAELSRVMEQSSSRAAETIAAEGTLAELTAKQEEMQIRREKLSAVYEAMRLRSLLDRYTSFEKMRETEAILVKEEADIMAPYTALDNGKGGISSAKTTLAEAVRSANSAYAEILRCEESIAAYGDDTVSELMASLADAGDDAADSVEIPAVPPVSEMPSEPDFETNEIPLVPSAKMKQREESKAKELHNLSDPAAITAEAAAIRSRKRSLFAMGIIFCLFAVLTAVLAMGMRLLYGSALYGLVISAIVFVAISAVCFLSADKARASLNAFLENWGADSFELLPAAIEKAAAELEEQKRRKDEIFGYMTDIEVNTARIFEIGASVQKYVIAAGADALSVKENAGEVCNMLTSALENVQADEARVRESASDLILIRQRIADMTDVLRSAELDRAGAESRLYDLMADADVAAALAEDARSEAEIKRERDFTEAACTSMNVKIHETEKKLVALKAVGAGLFEAAGAAGTDPAAVSVLIDEMDGKIRELQLRHDAYALAAEALADASESVRSGVSPRLAARAGQLMHEVTGGKYGTLGVDHDLTMTYMSDGMTRESGFMSAGTRDAAYISLRIALLELLFEKDRPPMIFDESFAYLDDDRLAGIMRILEKSAADSGQCFVLSCHDREKAVAKNVNVISL